MRKTLIMLITVLTILLIPNCIYGAVDAQKYSITTDNGSKINVYLIDDVIYVRPVDISQAYTGTSLSFDVEQDKNSVTVLTLRKNSSINTGKFKGKALYEKIEPTQIDFKITGIDATGKLDCYKIENNDFVRLRDLGGVVGFSYKWDKPTGSISITKNPVSPILGSGNMGLSSDSYIDFIGELVYSVVASGNNMQVLSKSADIITLLAPDEYKTTNNSISTALKSSTTQQTQPLDIIPNGINLSLSSSAARNIDPDKPMVALTFDDGPKAGNTEQILEALDAVDGRATFFMVGTNVENYPDTVKAIHEQGSELANHSYNHPQLTKLGTTGAIEQIEHTNSLISDITGVKPTIGRPPYGSIDSDIITASNMDWFNWSVDTLDWKYRNADTVFDTVIRNTDNKDVILMHDIHSSTVEAAVRIIPKLNEMGYQLVTISELAEYCDGAENVSGYIEP